MVLLETRTVEVLATETIDRAPSSGRLKLACANCVGADPTEIVGYLDGDDVIRASHPRGFGSFTAIAIVAGLDVEADMDVLWDDIYVDGSF